MVILIVRGKLSIRFLVRTTQIATLEVDESLVIKSRNIAEPINNFFFSIGTTFGGKIPETPNPLLENEYSVKP